MRVDIVTQTGFLGMNGLLSFNSFLVRDSKFNLTLETWLTTFLLNDLIEGQ